MNPDGKYISGRQKEMTLKKLVTGLSAAMISAAMISAAMAGTAMAGTWRTEAGKGPDGKTWY